MADIIAQNTLLLEEQVAKDGKDPDLLINLGAHYHMLGEYEKTAEKYEKAYGLSGEIDILEHFIAAKVLQLNETSDYAKKEAINGDMEWAFSKIVGGSGTEFTNLDDYIENLKSTK